MSFPFEPMLAYSQEPPPPPTQEKITIKTNKAKTEIDTKTNTKPSQDRMPVIVDKIYTNSEKTHRQHPNTKTKNGLKGTEPKETMWGITEFFNLLLVFFTGALVICNILLWISTKKSADAAKESAELVKQGFIATHRPKLRVHSVVLEKIDPPPKQIVNGSYITHHLHYSIDNIGGNPATITKRSTDIKRFRNQFLPPPYGTPNIVKKTIECGENISESIDVEGALIWASSDSVYDDLHFFGYIYYCDNIGTTRRTAFCRLYNRETKHFTKIDNEDYEYSY